MERNICHFITNHEQKSLRERIRELITISKELKILVGFFYFSGITELYESLQKNPNIVIKVLIGMDVDKLINKLIEYANPDTSLTDKDRIDYFFKSLKTALTSEDMDRPEPYRQISYFLKLIQENRIIIRKTRKPNHSKLYIFKISEGQDLIRDTLFITGSSNLTHAGLSGQGEFNVEISDYGTKEAEAFFDDLWDDAVKITETEETKKKLIQIINTETMFASIKPFEAYTLVLKSYLDANSMKEVSLESLKETMEKKGYVPYKYQMDAVQLALSIINAYDGVIIADVVGLGKTIIACAVARLLRKRGIVISPPGIMGDELRQYGWRKYIEEFGLYDWEVFSSGKLDTILKTVRRCEDIEVIIIDEAHKYRNQDTESYELLKNICLHKKVILLTATPFSNSPSDVFSLLKLFTVPGKSKLSLTDNLDFLFNEYKNTFNQLSHIQKYHDSQDAEKKQKAQTYYNKLFGSDNIDLTTVKKRTKYLANTIRSIIQPVLIRRNRIDLQNDPDYQNEIKDLSRLENPKELFYELSPDQSLFYDKVISTYFGENGAFSGAIYRPYYYEEKSDLEDIDEDIETNGKDGKKVEEQREQLSQKNLYDFMRRLLVKRFESSFGAFQQSVKNFIEIHKKILQFIEKTNKYILNRKLLEHIYEMDPDEIDEELERFKEEIAKLDKPDSHIHKVYDLKDFHFKDEFIKNINDDIQLFEGILKEIEDLHLIQKDPKSKSLAEEIPKIIQNKEENESKRKIVIFTEYIDTARHLEEQMKHLLPENLKNRILTVIGKPSDDRYETLLKNFDASYEKNQQEDTYDILITTDRLSEGFNLNRAGAVINYDIPWNPTRVIQRVGRINRISKKVYNTLYIYNFFPTETGADVVKSREIAQHKMFLIHNTIGEDARIFEPDEEPTASRLYTKVMTLPDELEPESLYTTIKKKYYEIKKNYPEVIRTIEKYPSRVKTAKKYHTYNLVVFLRKGRSIFVKYTDGTPGTTAEKPLEDALNYIQCEYEEQPLHISDKFWNNYISLIEVATTDFSRGRKIWTEAMTNIKTILQQLPAELDDYKSFLNILSEDISYYRTLSDYTIRRIRNLKLDKEKQFKEFKEVIDKLRNDLGDDYLTKIKNDLISIKPEVIIAMENQP
ncbi:MAG: helicase-related protein [Candidatus Hydrogenedens sp.]